MVILLECALNTEHSKCSMSCVRTVSTRAASRFSGVVAPRKHFFLTSMEGQPRSRFRPVNNHTDANEHFTSGSGP
jgi:hypothetical protein